MKCVFERDMRPSALEVHRWIQSFLRLTVDQIDMIQLDTLENTVYVKLISLVAYERILFERQGQHELKLTDGRISKVHISAAGQMQTTVRVFRVPPEVPVTAITAALSKYGKVINQRREDWSHNYVYKVNNGITAVRMEIREAIPSFVMIEGYRAQVIYEGQARTCLACNSTNHVKQDCPLRRNRLQLEAMQQPEPQVRRIDPVPPQEYGENLTNPDRSANGYEVSTINLQQDGATRWSEVIDEVPETDIDQAFDIPTPVCPIHLDDHSFPALGAVEMKRLKSGTTVPGLSTSNSLTPVHQINECDTSTEEERVASQQYLLPECLSSSEVPVMTDVQQVVCHESPLAVGVQEKTDNDTIGKIVVKQHQNTVEEQLPEGSGNGAKDQQASGLARDFVAENSTTIKSPQKRKLSPVLKDFIQPKAAPFKGRSSTRKNIERRK